MKTTHISDCTLVNPGQEPLLDTTVSFSNGVISGISNSPGTEGVIIDGRGLIAVPGFVEVHIQGAGGADVLDSAEPDSEALDIISETQARYGVTSYLATTVYKPGQENTHLLKTREYMERSEQRGAECLGIHLEGPFISQVKKGMIQPDCISGYSEDIFNEINMLCGESLKMMTVAPEIVGSRDLVRLCNDTGVVPSFGHSEATYEQTKETLGNGISHVTHLFNAMMPIHHRNPGPLPAMAEDPSCTVQVISDGVHIHRELIKHVASVFGCSRIVLITDGMQAMGLPDGEYVYNGITYESSGGAARYHDGTLIGTSLGLSDILFRFMEYTGIPLEQALACVTEVPARVIGVSDRKGSLEEGKDADIVLLTPDNEIKAVFARGNIVYGGV